MANLTLHYHGIRSMGNIKDTPLESKIQSRIIKRYEQQGYMVVKLVLTNKPGIPDLLLLKNGVASFVEVKRPKNKPRPLQLYRMEQLKEQGFEVKVLSE